MKRVNRPFNFKTVYTFLLLDKLFQQGGGAKNWALHYVKCQTFNVIVLRNFCQNIFLYLYFFLTGNPQSILLNFFPSVFADETMICLIISIGVCHFVVLRHLLISIK